MPKNLCISRFSSCFHRKRDLRSALCVCRTISVRGNLNAACRGVPTRKRRPPREETPRSLASPRPVREVAGPPSARSSARGDKVDPRWSPADLAAASKTPISTGCRRGRTWPRTRVLTVVFKQREGIETK